MKHPLEENKDNSIDTWRRQKREKTKQVNMFVTSVRMADWLSLIVNCLDVPQV